MPVGEWRICCVTTEGPHKHIVSVGIGVPPAMATAAVIPNMEYDLDTVYKMMTEGSTFITRSIITKGADKVRKQECGVDGCTVMTLKSGPNAHTDQVVESMPACPEPQW